MELDDRSLDINVFDKLMEGKHNEIVSNNDDDSMSIENTDNLFHFGQTSTPDKSYININNNNNDNYEIAFPFSKIIKLKKQTEAAP
jgi:hypothetical protein